MSRKSGKACIYLVCHVTFKESNQSEPWNYSEAGEVSCKVKGRMRGRKINEGLCAVFIHAL